MKLFLDHTFLVDEKKLAIVDPLIRAGDALKSVVDLIDETDRQIGNIDEAIVKVKDVRQILESSLFKPERDLTIRDVIKIALFHNETKNYEESYECNKILKKISGKDDSIELTGNEENLLLKLIGNLKRENLHPVAKMNTIGFLKDGYVFLYS